MKFSLRNVPESATESARGRVWELLFGSGGVASIEFVIIVPLMLFVLLGFTELYLYKRAVSMIEHTAFTLADSIGQMSSVVNSNATTSANSLGSIWSAAATLAQPNQLNGKGGVVITSICDKTTTCTSPGTKAYSMSTGSPQILWQATAPWTLTTMKSKEVSGALLPSIWPFRGGDSAIVVEVFYTYNPFAMTSAFWSAAPGTQTIYERVYVRPRTVPALAYSTSS